MNEVFRFPLLAVVSRATVQQWLGLAYVLGEMVPQHLSIASFVLIAANFLMFPLYPVVAVMCQRDTDKVIHTFIFLHLFQSHSAKMNTFQCSYINIFTINFIIIRNYCNNVD